MAQEDQQQQTVDQRPTGDSASAPSPAQRNGNGNGAGAAPSKGSGAAARPGAPAFTRNPLFRIIAVIVIVIALIWGVAYYRDLGNHESTDDAYITGDLVNVSPIISGTLAKLTVDEGDVVKKGQVIAVLDESGPRAAYEQASAAYQAALTQIPQAQTTLKYESANVQAQIAQAQAALSAQQAKTAQSQQQVTLTAATTQSQVQQAGAQAAAALAQAETAQATANSAVQAVQTAQSAASAAHQEIKVAQANYTRAQRDAGRYSALYGNNGSVAAVTAQQLDTAVATADSAQAQLQASQDQAAQADSQVIQAAAQAKAAQATASAAMKQYNASLAEVRIARANTIQVPVQKYGVANNAAVSQQNAAELEGAQANLHQVSLRKQQVETAVAEAAQAKAAMQAALVTLDDCTISAPSDGVVVRKGANVGDALVPGQTIVTVTRGSYVWVSANYKETQLQYVRVGQPVTVDVDAFPGKVFHGKVLSINEASGNTTSLLPADNATGNFTKVIQRIPVKIQLLVPENSTSKDATEADIEALRQGMSCEPNIDVSSGRK